MAESLTIAHFFPRIRLEEGGVVQTMLDLCRSLADRGHHIILATCDATDIPPTWKSGQPNCPRIVELAKSTWSAARLSTFALEKFGSILGALDVMHLHTPWELSNLQLSTLLMRNQIPYVVSVHGMLDDYCMQQKGVKKRAYLALGGRKLFSNANAVHFTAAAEREQALPWIPGNYLSIVQACAMNLTPYENLPGPGPALAAFPQIDTSRKKILFLSRLHPKKGVDILLRAAKLLKSESVEADLLIAGPGDEAYVAELKQLTSQLELNETTHFLGMVRGSVKLSLYELADVFVLPTHQENFGLVLPEALACGTPVVTTRGADIWRELAEAGAMIVDNQPMEISQAIAVLLSEDEKRRAIGQQGCVYVKNWLDEETVLAGYEQMYHDTIHHATKSKTKA